MPKTITELLQDIQADATSLAEKAYSFGLTQTDHEKLHVLLHISEACNINLDSEEFEYLSGEIAERLYPVSKQFICN